MCASRTAVCLLKCLLMTGCVLTSKATNFIGLNEVGGRICAGIH
jgi:hypothetical protein